MSFRGDISDTHADGGNACATYLRQESTFHPLFSKCHCTNNVVRPISPGIKQKQSCAMKIEPTLCHRTSLSTGVHEGKCWAPCEKLLSVPKLRHSSSL